MSNKCLLSFFLLLVCFGQSCSNVTPAKDPSSTKIVLISGPMDEHPGGSHEYERTILLLRHLLETSPSLKGITVESYFDGWPEKPSALDDADTIVINSAGTDRGLDYHPLYSDDRFQRIKKQMERGAGLVLLHNSTVNPSEHHDLITEWLGGYFDYQRGEGKSPYYSRVQNQVWNMALPNPDHPISRGVAPFTIKEEVYSRMRFRDNDPRLRPILLKQSEGPELENTIAWAVQREDGGRGFSFTGGHYYTNWWDKDFRTLVLNGIAWSAGLDIPEGGIVSELKDPINVLILTGHDHPAHDWRASTVALINVLRTDPRILVDVTEDPEDLAGEKLTSHDTLLLNYNNWDRPGLSEPARDGFARYLADGGGLTLLHFAGGAFNKTLPNNAESDWELYRTKIARRVWIFGESGHDPYGPFRVEITEVDHPITAGLKDFDTVDELYYRQVGSEPIEPLARAKSQKTGEFEPLAWAYDYERGRVFQTLLGHSGDSVRKAGALIRRGVTWSTGRHQLSFEPPAVLADKTGVRAGSGWTPTPQESEESEE